jgi:serine phosphatase RsbU (regulator of sigma subunit)
MIGTSLLNEIIIENGKEDTDQILYDMRTHIINSLDQQGELGESRDGMDMAICRWDKKDNKLTFSGAYNPLYIVRKGELLEYKANRRPVGYYIGKNLPFTKEEIELKKGDMLYIFSDGFIDQFGGEKGKKYRTRNFKKLLLKINGLPCDEQSKALDKELADWKGDTEQVDDVCVMGVRF